MAKVSAGDIRNGVTIEVDGKVCQVIDFMHVKPGKGAAFVRVKMKNIIISADDAADSMKFVKENEEVSISFYQGNAFAIEPPLSVELVVTETEPGVKGNTATGATKPAIVETGAKVNVPLFVDQGETIKIDTRTGAYLSRA